MVNVGRLLSRGEAMDLSRLNKAERAVLRLLAEGHTAKSIASASGMTPAAVNERLREARRKTGAASSRELARHLREQENGHDLFGMGKAQPTSARLSEVNAPPWGHQAGVVAMLCLSVVAAVGAAALMTQAPQNATSIEDPLASAPLMDGPSIAALHGRVRSESRDDPWADRLETAITARVSQIPLVGKDNNALRVTCGRSICEVAGTLIEPTDKAELDDPRSQFSQTVKALQVSPLPDDLAQMGLKFEAAAFTSGKGKPEKAAFFLYYLR